MYVYMYIYININIYINILLHMNRCWLRGDIWWTSNFPIHQKVSRKKYLTSFICFFLIISN